MFFLSFVQFFWWARKFHHEASEFFLSRKIPGLVAAGRARAKAWRTTPTKRMDEVFIEDVRVDSPFL